MSKRIISLLRDRILVLDGAMGTELHKRGLPAGVCPEAWCLANPEAVAQIHRAYREAGADAVYTATFGANRLKLGQYGLTNARQMNRTLAAVARGAVGRQGLVLGDIGPTGHFVEPFGDLPFAEAVALFREQAEGLLEGGVDGFVIETMMDIQEARAALIAVREVSDRFVLVTMTYEKHGRTLNGTDPISALITLQSLGADAVGCNCSAGPEGMLGMIAAMKPHARVPLAAKPNAGLPRLEGEATLFDMDAVAFAVHGPSFAEAGVNLLGGCCGTTPAHIAALRQSLADQRPRPPVVRSVAALSSARNALLLAPGSAAGVIGSRLNAAGNEALRQGIVADEPSSLRQAIRAQEKEGASLLQIRAVAPGLDEGTALPRMLLGVAATARLPFMIDADSPAALAQALRCYPGRALVRTADWGEALAQLLPVALRYGAMAVLCAPAEDDEALCRAALKGNVAVARKMGFAKADLVIEIPFPPAPRPDALRKLCRTLDWCGHLGCRTLLDLTPVGGDLPERRWLQAALLAVAQAAGLDWVILDPAVRELMDLRAALDFLEGRDQDGQRWRTRFA
jgi:5-methyltetrahydrofolate--homocysteine methyltransferase